MAETYSIYVKVDSTQATTAAKDLDKLGEASVTAEVSLKKLGSSSTSTAKSIADATKAVQHLANEYRNAAGVIDTSGLAAKLGMGGAPKALTESMDAIDSASRKAAGGMDALGKIANSVRSTFVLFVGIEIARFLRDTAGATKEAADAYTDMKSKLDIATYSQKELNQAFTDSFNIANKYYTSVTDVASAYAKFNPIVASLGRNTADTAKIVESLSASLLISGNNTVDAAETFRQFAQAISGPKVQMEEMNTIIDSNQALWRGLQREFPGIIAKYGSLKEAISKQAITNEMLINATIKLGDEFEALAARKVPTISNAMAVLSNSFVQYVGEADDASGASGALASVILDLAEALRGVEGKGQTLATVINTIAQAMAGTRGAVSEYIDLINGLSNAYLAFTGRQAEAAGTDPELARLMQLGQGNVPIADLAAKPNVKPTTQPQLTPKGTGGDAKQAAKDAKDALAAFKALIDAQVSAAENAEKVFAANANNSKKRFELEADQIRNIAELKIRATKSEEMRLAITEEAQAKIIESINQETNLRQAGLDKEIETVNAKLAGVQQEIAAADEHKLKQAERIALTTQQAELETDLAVKRAERTQIELDAIGQIQDAEQSLAEARQQAEEAMVKDEALRQLEVMSSNLEYAKEMATGLADAFGEVGAAIGGMSVAMAEYEKQIATVEIARKEAVDKAEGDQKKIAEINAEAATKQSRAQLKAYGDMTASAQKFFKQGSKGYEAMGAAVKVFRTFEMAQSAISAASQIGDMAKNVETFITGILGMTAAETASVAPTVAAETTKGAVKAKTAVVSQGQIPIAGFALMAAMAALVATMGFNTGGGGSAPAVAEPGTGTVLGDPTAQSESFKNSLDLLVEINSNDLAYSADMLESLRNIESALADASALVAKQILPLIESVTSQSDVSSMLSSSKVTEAGFLVGAQSLLKVISSGQLQGSIGARTESTTGLFGEFKSASTQLAQYGKGIAEAFGKIVQNIYSNVAQSADKIGIPFEEIQKRAEGLKVGLGKVNLAGKSSEEAAKAIEAAFSAMGDKMAMKLLPEFKDFQQSGEGYWQTINRVGAGVAEATGRLELLGMEAIKYTDIQKKSGDISAEITRQTIMAQGDLNEGTREYVRQLTGSASDIIEAYGQILNITNMMRGAGFGTANIDRTMINAAGGLTKFEEALTTFTENFLTPAQRVKSDIASMSAEFQKFGQRLPTSREEFTKLILSVDDSTEAGRKLKGQIIGLTPAFDDFISQMDDLRATFDDTKNSIADLQSSLASDIAGLRSPEAEAALIAGTVEKAWSDLYDYMQGVVAGNERNFEYEIQQLGDIRSGVMSRYNAELGLIRQAAQAQAAAIKESADIQIGVLKDGLNAQIEAINATANAQIEAINANLDAELEMRQKAHEAALDSLQKELDAAQKLKSAVDQVRVYAMGMRLGANSMLSPEQRLQEAQRQYSGLLSRAQGGDAEAMSQLTGAADAYLESAKKYFGSSTQYANVFEGVKQAMESIGSMKVTDPDSIQAKVDVLRESQQKELQSLRDTAKEQIESIKQSSQDQISAAKDALDVQVKAIQDATKNQIDALTDPEQNEAIKALKAATIAELERVGIMLGETEYANERRSNDLETIQLEQLAEMRNQSSILSVIASNGAPDLSSLNPIGPFLPVSGDNGSLANTLNAVAIETKAGVALQSNAFSQMVDSLSNIDDRLSKMERSQRLSA